MVPSRSDSHRETAGACAALPGADLAVADGYFAHRNLDQIHHVWRLSGRRIIAGRRQRFSPSGRIVQLCRRGMGYRRLSIHLRRQHVGNTQAPPLDQFHGQLAVIEIAVKTHLVAIEQPATRRRLAHRFEHHLHEHCLELACGFALRLGCLVAGLGLQPHQAMKIGIDRGDVRIRDHDSAPLCCATRRYTHGASIAHPQTRVRLAGVLQNVFP